MTDIQALNRVHAFNLNIKTASPIRYKSSDIGKMFSSFNVAALYVHTLPYRKVCEVQNV
jgi:hypothetical protein